MILNLTVWVYNGFIETKAKAAQSQRSWSRSSPPEKDTNDRIEPCTIKKCTSTLLPYKKGDHHHFYRSHCCARGDHRRGCRWDPGEKGSCKYSAKQFSYPRRAIRRYGRCTISDISDIHDIHDTLFVEGRSRKSTSVSPIKNCRLYSSSVMAGGR